MTLFNYIILFFKHIPSCTVNIWVTCIYYSFIYLFPTTTFQIFNRSLPEVGEKQKTERILKGLQVAQAAVTERWQ